MQQLTEAFEHHMKCAPDDGGLREAATKWSAYAIKNFDGKLLKASLNLSAAIAQFCNELEKEV